MTTYPRLSSTAPTVLRNAAAILDVMGRGELAAELRELAAAVEADSESRASS